MKSSMFIDVLVQADPIPTPPPNPAMTLRAEEEPPRDNTIPIIPPSTKPAAPFVTTFSNPSLIVSVTNWSEGAFVVGDFVSISMMQLVYSVLLSGIDDRPVLYKSTVILPCRI